MKRFIFLPILLLVLLYSQVLASWNQVMIGNGTNHMKSVALGAAKNDNITRLYGANVDGNIYEFSYAGSAWNGSPLVNNGGSSMNSVTIGNGRNDGSIHVYGACGDGNIYEYSYAPANITIANPNGWAKSSMGSGGAGSSMNCVVIGAGRNDSSMHVYAACSDGNIYEFTYSSSAGNWNKINITNGILGSAPVNSVVVGNGRNDGIMRVYGAFGGGLSEFTFNTANNSWTQVSLGGTAVVNGVAVGNGRSDGITHVYGANADGYLHEWSYSNGIWNTVSLGNGGQSMNGVALGLGENDNVTRVYGACNDSNIYEFTNVGGNTWNKAPLGNSGNLMWAAAIGSGRNDNVMRVYGANDNNNMYEFTYTNNGNNNNNNNNSNNNSNGNNTYNAFPYPSFANISQGGVINFKSVAPGADVKIFTPAGNLVQKLKADSSGVVQPWDGTVQGGSKAGSGTYIVRVSDNNGHNRSFRILIVN